MHIDVLKDLNPSQREAVEAVDGPLLILAGPGSGKTRVITHRIAHLVVTYGISPRSIAAVTFTNKAAREMRDRLFGKSQSDPTSPLLGDLWNMRSDFSVATFHALCSQILRREADYAGLDRSFVIYDQEDQLVVLKQVMEQLQIDPQRFPPRSILSAISAAKSQLIEPDAYPQGLSNPMERNIAQAYQRYQELLHSNNAVDFDDLLLKTQVLFRDHQSVLERYRSRFEYLLIDEFQDTNVAQYSIAKQLASKHRNICVVGDPDQAIYSWRNADIRNILSFERDYPDAKKVTLEENYRSTGAIVEAATEVISANRQRLGKSLTTQKGRGNPLFVSEAYDPDEEAQQVLREIDRLKREEGHSLGDCAVMYRVNAQSRALEEVCLRYGIPYKLIGGLRFYQRREIKDVIAYLRVIHNPYDEVSLRRIINVPPRGIGQRTLDQLIHTARVRNLPVYTAVQLMAETGEDGARPNRAVARFLHIINTLMEYAGSLSVEELIDAVLERAGYGEHLRAEGEQGLERLENIRELRSTAHEFQPMEPEERLSAFLEGAAPVSDVDSLEEGGDGITRNTLHQDIEYPMAWDPVRVVMVDVADARRGGSGLVCPDPECSSEMVAAQGPKNAWHFRHAKYPCQGYLHYTIVKLLAQRLSERLDGATPFQLRYPCWDCDVKFHNQDAFAWADGNVQLVKKERESVEGARIKPDITLCHGEDKPLAFIEVVDTHPPEESVLAVGLPVFVVNASYPLLHSLRDATKSISPLEVSAVYNVTCGELAKGTRSIEGYTRNATEPDERLSAFLEGVALVSDVDSLEEGTDAITLITLHQAKGLEFPVVFIVGLEEGLLPHSRSIDDPDQMEEERRLFYVGMTRAKERLYLTRAFRRGFWGNTSAVRPSRFLGDVPQRLITSLSMAGQKSAVPGLQGDAAGGENTAVAIEAPLKDGDRVRHSKFGEGIVVSCMPTSQDYEVTVAFKGESGIKKLLYSFAPLQKVELVP